MTLIFFHAKLLKNSLSIESFLYCIKSERLQLNISQTFFSGSTCWKNKTLSYNRGAGTDQQTRCPPHHPDKFGGLCFKRCQSGYTSFGCCLCTKARRVYWRGAGTKPELYCPSTSSRPVKIAGLCYQSCQSGYTGVSLHCVIVQIFKACRESIGFLLIKDVFKF